MLSLIIAAQWLHRVQQNANAFIAVEEGHHKSSQARSALPVNSETTDNDASRLPFVGGGGG